MSSSQTLEPHSGAIPFVWPLLSRCTTIGCFQWCRPQTSGRSGLSWGTISLYPKGRSFTKLLFILFLILSYSSHFWRISKVFFFFLHFTVVISTVFWSAFIFMLSLCRMCLSVWVQAHTNTFRAQSQVVVLPLHLTWDRLSWWWRVQQAAGLQGPVRSLILHSLSLRSAGIPEGRHHTQHICGLWDLNSGPHAYGRYFTHWAVSSSQVSIHFCFSFSIFSFLFLVIFYFSCLPWHILCKRFALSYPFRSIPRSVWLLLKISAWPGHQSFMT